MEKFCCGLCGAPILHDVIIIVESNDGKFRSEDTVPCSNRGCGLLHNKEGVVMTIDGDGLFLSYDDDIAMPEKERTFLM